MNKLSLVFLFSLLAGVFIQLGAQLFAILVIVSTLVESPPESFALIRGDFAYDSSKFWDVYPTISGSLFLIAIAFNWKTRFRKWILLSFGMYIIGALFAVFVLEPTHAEVIGMVLNEPGSVTLQEQALLWYRLDWILCLLTFITGLLLVVPLFKQSNLSPLKTIQDLR
jgi:hypothetical protein